MGEAKAGGGRVEWRATYIRTDQRHEVSQVCYQRKYVSIPEHSGDLGTSCEHGLNGSLTNFTALRLHPVVPLNARMSIADTVLPRGGGPDGSSPIFIPAKTPVCWNLYAMHRREDLFGKDAEDFRPERWETLRAGWEYLPFNGGPRICIGRK